MRDKSSIPMLVASAALALVLAGCGPGNGNDQAPRRGSTAAQPAKIPPDVNKHTRPPIGPTQTETNPTGQMANAGLPSDAAQFDKAAGGKGYITRAEARQIPWLEIHFSQCNTTHDGRITHAQFNQCRHRLGELDVRQPNSALSG